MFHLKVHVLAIFLVNCIVGSQLTLPDPVRAGNPVPYEALKAMTCGNEKHLPGSEEARKCKFAHNLKQLNKILYNYKTEDCTKSKESKGCKHGTACWFVHYPVERREPGSTVVDESIWLALTSRRRTSETPKISENKDHTGNHFTVRPPPGFEHTPYSVVVKTASPKVSLLNRNESVDSADQQNDSGCFSADMSTFNLEMASRASEKEEISGSVKKASEDQNCLKTPMQLQLQGRSDVCVICEKEGANIRPKCEMWFHFECMTKLKELIKQLKDCKDCWSIVGN